MFVVQECMKSAQKSSNLSTELITLKKNRAAVCFCFTWRPHTAGFLHHYPRLIDVKQCFHRISTDMIKPNRKNNKKDWSAMKGETQIMSNGRIMRHSNVNHTGKKGRNLNSFINEYCYFYCQHSQWTRTAWKCAYKKPFYYFFSYAVIPWDCTEIMLKLLNWWSISGSCIPH